MSLSRNAPRRPPFVSTPPLAEWRHGASWKQLLDSGDFIGVVHGCLLLFEERGALERYARRPRRAACDEGSGEGGMRPVKRTAEKEEKEGKLDSGNKSASASCRVAAIMLFTTPWSIGDLTFLRGGASDFEPLGSADPLSFFFSITSRRPQTAFSTARDIGSARHAFAR